MGSVARRRVLIADNNADLALILGEFIRMDGSLEYLGHVHTGAAAFARTVSGEVDVLVLDLGLEDCNGFEVLDRLRQAGSATKVVIHTGHSGPELAEAARRRGAAGFVVKSGDPAVLIAAIRDAP
jgi:two-component system, NarL family, invasion response regulator UvrY